MKHVLMFVIAVAAVCMSAQAQLSGIYVEFYNPGAPYYVAPDGWQTVPGHPCRHGPDPDGDGIPNSLGTPEPGWPSGSHITLSDVTTKNYRVFAVNPDTTDIGSISVYGDSGESPTLYIGYAVGFPDSSSLSPMVTAGARNLGGLSYGSPKLRVKGFIQGTLTGSVSAHEIIRFDFGTAVSSGTGTIAANITHNPSADSSVTQLGGIFAKRVAPGAVITSYNSNIRWLETYSDFEGAVQATEDKNIQQLRVGRDFKGSVLVGGDLNNLQIVRNGTGSIAATGNLGTGAIFGHWGAQPVGSTPNYQSSSIDVGSISTSLLVAGDFVGQLQAGSIQQLTVSGGFYDHSAGTNTDGSLLVDGNILTVAIGTPILGGTVGNMLNLEADSIINAVALTGDFASGSALLRDGLPAGSSLRIGGSVASGVTIEIENDPLDPNIVGLQGQILVNQSGGAGIWSGIVQVYDGTATTLLSPNYATLSTDIGNGAVGLAPFNFHQFTGPLGTGDIRDCNPYHTEFRAVDICDQPTRVDEVVIDHYGPVHTNGTGPYYRVEFLPAFFDPSTGPQWINVTDQFQVDTTRTSSSPTGNNRKVYIIAKDQENGFNAAGRFRFRPLVAQDEGDKVRCSNVNDFPNVAYQSSVVSGDLGSTTGTQHHWYQFRVGLLVPDCESSSMLFENDRVNAADLAAWLDNPFEVNMDGRICAQDFALMADAYDPE